jgi:single-stranded DNA-binding protein
VINVVEISGTLSADPTLVDAGASSIRCDFTLAVPNVRYDRRTNTDVIDTAFIRVVSWEKPAEVAAVLHKGCVVHVRGELTQEEVTDARGRKERKTKVRAATVAAIRIAPPPAPTDGDYPTF